MIEVRGGVEGECLIRQLLYYLRRSNSREHTLRLTCRRMPSPSTPQILARTGIGHLEICCAAADGSDDANTQVSRSIDWRGIDGTHIETRIVAGSNSPICPEVHPDAVRQSDGSTLWSGELEPFIFCDQPSGSSLLDGVRIRLVAAMKTAEFMATVCPAGFAQHPESELQYAWDALLHDTDDYDQSLLVAAARVEDYNTAAIAELGGAVDTRGLKRPVFVVSNLSFYGNEVVSVALRDGEEPVTAIGPEGDAQPVQIIQACSTDGVQSRQAIFVAKNAPLHGYSVWDLAATLIPTEPDDEVTASPTHLENSAIRVEFDANTGLILRIFDKDSEREVLNETYDVQRSGKRDLKLGSCANVIEISEPGSLCSIATGRSTGPLLTLDRADVVEAGPVRGAIRQTRSFLVGGDGGTSITVRQEIRLIAGSARIDFVTEVDWDGLDRSLTVSFPVAINSSRATYEIPFGYVERPTYANGGNLKPPFEAQACHWVDLSEGDYGVAVLSNGSTECDVRGNTLRLGLRAGAESAAYFGQSRLTYSLLPHGGDLREGEVIENAGAMIKPPSAVSVTGNKRGSLPLSRSFFEVDSAALFIQSIRPCEKSEEEAIIVRLCEAHNTRGEVLLTTALPIRKAWLCDLLETNLVELPLENGEVLLPFHPFEIITVRFVL